MILSHFHSCLQALWSLSTALRQEWALNCLITGPVRICCLGNRMDMNDHESCESWMYFICHRELGWRAIPGAGRWSIVRFATGISACTFLFTRRLLQQFCIELCRGRWCCSLKMNVRGKKDEKSLRYWIYIYICTIYDKDEQIEMMILIRMMTMMTIIMIYIYVGMTKLLSWW